MRKPNGDLQPVNGAVSGLGDIARDATIVYVTARADRYTAMAENASAKGTFADALTAMNVEVVTDNSYALKDTMAELLTRARDAGSVRADIELPIWRSTAPVASYE